MRPSSVKVGYLTFEVLYVSDRKWRKLEFLDDRACGQTSGALATIWIRTYKDQEEAVTREVLLHELLHTVFYVSSLGAIRPRKKEWEEIVVRTMSPLLLCLLQENPDLADYLNGV